MGEAVVEREDDQHHVVLGDGDDAVALGHVGRVVAVGQQDALRVGGGAGGVADVGVVVGAHALVAGHELGLVLREERVAHLLDLGHADLLVLQLLIIEGRVVEDDDLLHVGALREDLADLRQEVAGHEDPLGLGMRDAEDQVGVRTEVDGEGHVGGAGVQGSELGEDPHGTALGEQGDLVSLLQAEGHQARADAVGREAGLLLGDLLPLAVHLLAEVGVVGELVGILLDKVDDGGSVAILHRFLSCQV